MKGLEAFLNKEASRRNAPTEVSEKRPDPILIARKSRDPRIALVCALFSYGNVTTILRFLNTLDFSLLDASETTIQTTLSSHYYRFQNASDVTALFIALRRLASETTLEALFMEGYTKESNILDGLAHVIARLETIHPHSTKGYRFLIGSPPDKTRTAGASALKRWNMFLRWMVRKDAIDFGLWQKVATRDLIIPLDTHTFGVSRALGLIERKQYDLKAALLLTESLKRFDAEDPVRYDFALYRIGQEKGLIQSLRK